MPSIQFKKEEVPKDLDKNIFDVPKLSPNNRNLTITSRLPYQNLF